MKLNFNSNISFQKHSKKAKSPFDFNMYDIRKFNKETKGFNRRFLEMQNGDVVCIARYEGFSKSSDEQYPIGMKKILTQSGVVYKTRYETPDKFETIETHNYRGDDFILVFDWAQLNLLTEIFQIKNQGAHPQIIHTKISDKIEGYFDIDEYDLEDFSEDIDVIKEIKKNNIKPSRKISQTSVSDDGEQNVEENYDWQGCKINRTYRKTPTQNGYKTQFEYKILDENGLKILDLDRSFEYSPLKSTTNIFGRIYESEFDNENYMVTITKPNGLKTQIDFALRLGFCDSMQSEELWQIFKQLPSDLQLDFSKYIDLVFYCDEEKDVGVVSSRKMLYVTPSQADFAHEIGHCIDYDKDFKDNKELIEIYEKEQAKFREELPMLIQDEFKYFSSFKSKDDETIGIEEIIAETSQLLTGIVNNKKLSYRAQLIVQYFPKTVAQIAYLKFNNY